MLLQKKLLLAIGTLVSIATVRSTPVLAATFTLDFETATTGSTLDTTPLASPLGTISSACTGICDSSSFSLFFQDQVGVDSNFALLNFGFDVTSLTFDYSGGGGGAFTAQALNASGVIIDSFFNASTSAVGIEGTISLNGTGIRALKFGDFPGGADFSYIDNLTITTPTATAVPEPLTAIASLIGGAAAIRMRKKMSDSK